jgi:hypothetical protein
MSNIARNIKYSRIEDRDAIDIVFVRKESRSLIRSRETKTRSRMGFSTVVRHVGTYEGISKNTVPCPSQSLEDLYAPVLKAPDVHLLAGVAAQHGIDLYSMDGYLSCTGTCKLSCTGTCYRKKKTM